METTTHTYAINTECGLMRDFEAQDIEAAKDTYGREHPYDFDGYADYPGSWYWINQDGVRVESHCECMP